MGSEVGQVDEEYDGVEGCQEYGYCVHYYGQLFEHVEEYLEVFQAYMFKLNTIIYRGLILLTL